MGKVMQHLQSVKCHDSRAHGHERYGHFIRLVGLWLVWFGSGWVYLGLGGLVIGMLQVSFGRFLATGVRLVSLWTLVTGSNLSA
jgi:hypothetical protein